MICKVGTADRAFPVGPRPLEYFRVRKLIPNLEQVTCREPTVTPMNLAISSRETPSATQSLIFWMFSGVNFLVGLPLGVTYSAMLS